MMKLKWLVVSVKLLVKTIFCSIRPFQIFLCFFYGAIFFCRCFYSGVFLVVFFVVGIFVVVFLAK